MEELERMKSETIRLISIGIAALIFLTLVSFFPSYLLIFQSEYVIFSLASLIFLFLTLCIMLARFGKTKKNQLFGLFFAIGAVIVIFFVGVLSGIFLPPQILITTLGAGYASIFLGFTLLSIDLIAFIIGVGFCVSIPVIKFPDY